MDDLFEGRTWFAVVAKRGRAEEAHFHLREQGYSSFLPMCRIERRNGRKTEVVNRPLFDRYLFVGLLPSQPFHAIHSTPGVAFVVTGTEGRPTEVSIAALSRVKARCDQDGGVVDFLPSRRKVLPELHEGQPVRVIEGPFEGLMGIFSAFECGAAKILLELFGRHVVTSVKAHFLQPDAAYGSAVAIARAA